MFPTNFFIGGFFGSTDFFDEIIEVIDASMVSSTSIVNIDVLAPVLIGGATVRPTDTVSLKKGAVTDGQKNNGTMNDIVLSFPLRERRKKLTFRPNEPSE